MSNFNDSESKKLIAIQNWLCIIGAILILISLFIMPTGVILLIIGIILIICGICMNGSVKQKQNEEIENYRREQRNSVEHTYKHAKVPDISNTITSNHQTHSKILKFFENEEINPFRGSDLLESSDESFVCSECAKYTKRWFSEYGENPKYPKLPDYFKSNTEEHKHCAIRFTQVLDNISIPAWNYKGDFVKYCNRPFVDERTEEQKRIFNDYIEEDRRKKATREEYEWLSTNLPDAAPKSLSGYSRMKNANTQNYIKLKTLAEKAGKILE